jgi:hypothetical protein
MMNRFLPRIAVLTVAGLALVATAEAIVPNPDLSNVPDCVVISPNGALAYCVTIAGEAGVINASRVELRFTNVADTMVCWCSPRPTPRPPSFFQNTGPTGVACFNLLGGGCIQRGLAAIPGTRKYAGEVFADNIKMQEFGIVSPDAADAAGRIATNQNPTWDPMGSCLVGLSDAVRHTTPLATNVYNWCSDINCDDIVGLFDGVNLTTYLAQAISCPGDQSP